MNVKKNIKGGPMPRYENKSSKNDPIPNFKMFFSAGDEEPISWGDLSGEACPEFLNYVCKRGNMREKNNPCHRISICNLTGALLSA